MRNEEHFKELVNKLNNIDRKYDNELNVFVNYLVSNDLIDRCFDLTPYDMDKYFESLINVKIGSSSSLNRHIAALSALFEYLYSEKLGFRSLHGYINMNDFRNKYLVKLDAGSKKEIIPKDILIDVLNKIDTYYQEHKTDKENSKFYSSSRNYTNPYRSNIYSNSAASVCYIRLLYFSFCVNGNSFNKKKEVKKEI